MAVDIRDQCYILSYIPTIDCKSVLSYLFLTNQFGNISQ